MSHFAAAELASSVSRLVRVKDITKTEAKRLFAKFDLWKSRSVEPVLLDSGDVEVAEKFLWRLDLILRAPDALHIAMALRSGGALVTFDVKMAAGGKALGLAIAEA